MRSSVNLWSFGHFTPAFLQRAAGTSRIYPGTVDNTYIDNYLIHRQFLRACRYNCHLTQAQPGERSLVNPTWLGELFLEDAVKNPAFQGSADRKFGQPSYHLSPKHSPSAAAGTSTVPTHGQMTRSWVIPNHYIQALLLRAFRYKYPILMPVDNSSVSPHHPGILPSP